MGRPIQKKKMLQSFGGSSSGKLAVTAYRGYGDSLTNSTTAYIVSQRGSKKFKIHLEDSTEEVMLLKAVAPGSLSGSNAGEIGEFCVQVILDDSTVAYVEKFYNNPIHYVTTAGATGRVKYTLGNEGSDEQKTSNLGSIDVR